MLNSREDRGRRGPWSYAVPEKEADSEVTLRLYDVLGRHETQLSLQGLASGTYLLRLEAGESVKTRRLKVVR